MDDFSRNGVTRRKKLMKSSCGIIDRRFPTPAFHSIRRPLSLLSVYLDLPSHRQSRYSIGWTPTGYPLYLHQVCRYWRVRVKREVKWGRKEGKAVRKTARDLNLEENVADFRSDPWSTTTKFLAWHTHSSLPYHVFPFFNRWVFAHYTPYLSIVANQPPTDFAGATSSSASAAVVVHWPSSRQKDCNWPIPHQFSRAAFCRPALRDYYFRAIPTPLKRSYTFTLHISFNSSSWVAALQRDRPIHITPNTQWEKELH